MFEKILEKILLHHFGKFIQGFDKNNLKLGVWSGNIAIENVQLKPEVILNLELPFNLKFSNIGRLAINVPWNKLSSSPVEVLIQDVFILLNQTTPKEWDFNDQLVIQKKLNMLLNYADKQQKKVLGQEEEQEKGYFDKLTLKVIDNLQLVVKNIHIRCESATYSFGLTINSLEAITTNSSWVKNFIDRTDEKNKDKPMNKLVLLKELVLYWNSKETRSWSQYEPVELLEQKIEKLITITAEFKLVQNLVQRIDLPLFEVLISLDWIDINLKTAQIQQQISVLEAISTYTKLLWMKRKNISNQQVDADGYKEAFEGLFAKIFRSELKSKEELSGEDRSQLDEILRLVPYEVCFLWVQSVMKQVILQSKVQQLQKQRKKKGWFGWGGSAKNDDEMQESEIAELQQYIEQTMDKEQITRPQESLRYQVQFQLKGGSVIIQSQEGLKLILGELNFEMSQCQNKDFKSGVQLDNIALKTLHNESSILVTEKQGSVFEYAMEKNVDSLVIDGQLRPITIIYTAALVKIAREIKSIKRVDESLKAETLEKIEKISDQYSDRLQFLLENALKVQLNLKIDSPKLVLPLKSSQDESECWVLKVEQVHVYSKEEQQSDYYDRFELELRRLNFSQGDVSVIENYNMKLQVGKLKASIKEHLGGEHATVVSEVRLNPIELRLNEKIYHDLIYLPEIVYPRQNEQQTLELLQFQKQDILRDQIKAGWVKKRGGHLLIWHDTYCIFSAGYLHFYDYETGLMANSSVYIKNSTIEPVDDNQLYAFKISNRYDVCYLGCVSKQEIQDWITILDQKIKDYATQSQYLDMIDQDKHETKKTKTVSFDLKLQLTKCYVQMAKSSHIPQVNQQNQLITMQLEGLNYEQTQRKGIINIQVELRNFVLRDYVFDYENREYQDLILLDSRESEALVVKVDIVKPWNGLYKKVDIKVELVVDELYCNWKPDTFLLLRDFMLIISERKSRKWYFANVKDYEVEPLKKGMENTQEVRMKKLQEGMKASLEKCHKYSSTRTRLRDRFDSLLDYDQFIGDYQWIYEHVMSKASQYKLDKPSAIHVQLNGTINQGKINLFHRQSHCCIAKLDLSQCSFIFRKLQTQAFVDSTIGQLSLYDMTNYPHTLNSNINHKKVVPFLIAGRRQDTHSNSLPLVRFRFGGHDDTILVSEDRCNVFMLIELQPIFIIYQQQPIMRIIDYIIVQIVSLLKEPEFLTMNQEFLEQKRFKKTQNNLKAKRVWGDIDFILQKFICPTFVDCRVQLHKPLLQIKGWWQFPQYFQIDADMQSQFHPLYSAKIDNSRLLKPGGTKLTDEQGIPNGTIKQAWVEDYFVEGRNLVIQYVDDQELKNMSNVIHFNLSFQRLLHFNEVKEVYPEVDYDRSIKIRSAMTPLVLKAYRDEYQQICKMIFHNFQYDDFKDKLYIHDFEVVRSFDPAPISFFLDFTQLSIFAMSRRQAEPLAQVFISKMRLEWLKETNIDLNLFGEELSIFNYVKQDEYIEERGMVGDVKRHIKHQLQGQVNSFHIDQTFYANLIQQPSNFDLYEFDSVDQKNGQFTLLFKILRPVGDRNIYIYMRNVKMIVEVSVFANVGLWSILDQECWPPQNEIGEMPGVQLFVEIQNTILCLPATEGQHVMGTKGQISYVWNRARRPNDQWLIHYQKEGSLQPRLVQGIGDAFEHKITLFNFEIFKFIKNDFLTLQVDHIRKRNILMPFQFFLGIKNEIQITPDQSNPVVYYINKYEVNFDKTILRFSYQDLLVFQKIVNYFKAQNALIAREPVQQQQQEQPANTPVNNVYDAIIHGFQIVVINDAGEAYVPVVDLTLYESQLIFHQTRVKSILSTVISMSSTFYNPTIGVWEPIIERCTFALDMSLNERSNPKKYIILEMNSPNEILNFNVSAQMVNIFHKTQMSWVREMNAKHNDLNPFARALTKSVFEEDRKEDLDIIGPRFTTIHSSQTTESIDHVSPYTIRNETGFPIEVEDEETLSKYLLPAQSQINFKVDSNIEQLFTKDQTTLKGKRKIRFRLLHDQQMLDYIHGIDLDSIRSRRVYVRHNEKQYNIFVEVIPKDTRKLLLISTELVVYNKTDRVVQLRLFDSDGEQEVNVMQVQLEQNRAYSIPIDRCRSFMNFKFYDQFSQLIDLSLLGDLDNKSFQFKHSDNLHTLVRCHKRSVNQSMLYLEPPYIIKNCLPEQIEYEIYSDELTTSSKSSIFTADQTSIVVNQAPSQEMYSNLQSIQKGQLFKQQSMQIHNVSLNRRLAIKIKLPFFQWSDMGFLQLSDKISICDFRGKVYQISVSSKQTPNGIKRFYIYTASFAINDTPTNFYFYGFNKNKQPTLCSGQSIQQLDEKAKLVLLDTNPIVQLASSDQPVNPSKEINMNQTGNDCLFLQHYEFGVNVSIVCLDQEQQLFSKVLTVSPRYVIINQISGLLEVRQVGCENCQKIQTQQRVAFNWECNSNSRLIQIRLDSKWGFSQAIDPNQAGFTCLTVRQQGYNVRYVKCQLRIENQMIYLIFSECKAPPKSIKEPLSDKNMCPYLIVNMLQDVELICYQACFALSNIEKEKMYKFSEYKVMVQPQCQSAFAWEYPTETKEIVVELRNKELDEPILFSMEETDVEKEFFIDEFKFYAMTIWQGSSKKLMFYQEQEIIERLKQEDNIQMQMGLSISNIGISVMDKNQSRRCELMYITLKNVEFMMLETTTLRTSQLKIKYINIDNNSNQSTMFPVIFTPTRYQEIFEFDRPQLSLVIAQSTQVESLTLIKSIRACLQPTTIRLTSEMLEHIYEFTKSLQAQLEINVQSELLSATHDFEYALERQLYDQPHPMLHNQVQSKYGAHPDLDVLQEEYQYDWQSQELSLNVKTTYIDRIEIYPLQINLTFYNSVSSNVQYGMVLQILKTVGIVLGNIDEAPIKLKGIYLENCFDTFSGIMVKLITHCKENLIQQLLKILGSIEIIGNPVGLFKHVAIGVYDLFDKPIEGFIKGPIEGGIGIGKGVGSLCKNTLSGVSNSIGKIAGSMAGGLTAISLDHLFQAKREKMRMRKPKQIFDGVYQGVILLYQGVSRGVIGVVDLPIAGARQGGFGGAITGTLKGATGFFIKPFVGVFDFISKSSEGIKATALYWDDKANEKRERLVRVMYGQEQFYTIYNPKDAIILECLSKISKFADIDFYDGFIISGSHVLVLSYQYIIMVDVKKGKTSWYFESKQLSQLEVASEGLVFKLKGPDKQLKTDRVLVEVEESSYRQEVFRKTQWLVYSVENG